VLEDQLVWETCIVDPDYEICTTYPHQIKKKENGKIIKEWNNGEGYLQCRLNNIPYQKHRLISLQFILNPDQLEQVDHINHNRAYNRISNMRWISGSSNCRNKSSHKGIEYTFVDEIPTEAIHVSEYSGHEFTDLYFYNNEFYYFNGIQYRILHINERKNNLISVCIKDNDHYFVAIYYSKFKREYDLL
jgi:hypothetical protein